MLTHLAVAVFAVLPAQTPPAANSPAPAPVTATDLAARVRALDAGAATWIGSITEKSAAGGSDFGGMVVQIGGGGGAQPYSGNVEIVRTEKKELLIASLHDLPEVVVYDDGTRRLVRTTIAETPVGVTQLAGDLTRLLDLAQLANQLEKVAKVDSGEPGSDGSRVVSCELSPRSVGESGGGGPAAMFEPKVLAVRARFDLDPAGKIAALEFSVTRSDPMAQMRQRALASGGGAITLDASDVETGDDEGPTSTYRLRPKGDAPSAHARESLAAMRRFCESK